MERIQIDIVDNTLGKDINKLIKKLKSFLLDEGLVTKITSEDGDD